MTAEQRRALEVLMKPATTLDDVLKEVRELREEVRRYREAIESKHPSGVRINVGGIDRLARSTLDVRGTTEGKISFGGL
jgi:hypothetical protein